MFRSHDIGKLATYCQMRCNESCLLKKEFLNDGALKNFQNMF